MLTPTQPLGPECPSDLTLDQLAADELTSEARAHLQGHLATCPRCDAHARRRDAEARAFLASPASVATLAQLQALHARAPRPALPYRPVLAAFAVAAAALLALLVPREPLETVRTKGAADLTLGYWLKRGERVLRGTPEVAVAPHDQLRFTIRAGRSGHLTILSRDARGAASVYFPAPDGSTWIDGSRQERALDGAVELDDVLGEELVVGLLCDSPPVVELLRRALERGPTLEVPLGCRKSELRIVKERAAP